MFQKALPGDSRGSHKNYEVKSNRGWDMNGVIISIAYVFPIVICILSFAIWLDPSREVDRAHGVAYAQEESHRQGAENPTTQEEAPTVEVPVDRQQFIGVKLAEASIRPVQEVIRTVGRIEYDEKKLATVNTKFEGWIEKLYVDAMGMYVKKGDILAEIYSPELFATQLEYLNLLKWARLKRSDTLWGRSVAGDSEAILEATKSRLRLWDIRDDQIKEIELTGKPLRTLKIYSPTSGYVTQKMAVLGMRVMPGEKLFDLADLSNVWVIADIYEYELPLIRTGMGAELMLTYIPGKRFSAVVDYIYPFLWNETRTAKVRFTVPNPGGQLKPQMFSNVEIKINLGKKLTIPVSALIETGTRRIVYVSKGEGYFEPREVLVGVRGEEMVEITEGLKAGEKVATAANFLIDSEAQLKGVVPLQKH
jgi:Cu(I)/Ag(I) efflux system membrane fusion protein